MARFQLRGDDDGLGGLGDTAPGRGSMANLLEYGDRVASVVLAAAATVPAEQRTAVMRASFEALEPGLYDRVLTRMRGALSRGVPAQRALRDAIAHETSRGLVDEVLKIQRGGHKVIKARSRVGVAGWGAGPALGALPSALLSAPVRTPITQLTDPALRMCGPFYIYRDPNIVVRTSDHRGGTTVTTYDTITANRLAVREVEDGKEGHIVPAERCLAKFPEIRAWWNAKLAHASSSEKQEMLRGAKHFMEIESLTGKDYRLYYPHKSHVKDLPEDMLAVRIKPRSRKWYERAWDWTKEITLTLATGGYYLVWKFRDDIADIVGKVIEEVGDITCGILNDDRGQAAIGIAAGAYGAPPQAGVAGAQIAAGLCGGGQQSAPPPAATTSSVPVIPVVLGAGALGVFLMTRRRH